VKQFVVMLGLVGLSFAGTWTALERHAERPRSAATIAAAGSEGIAAVESVGAAPAAAPLDAASVPWRMDLRWRWVTLAGAAGEAELTSGAEPAGFVVDYGADLTARVHLGQDTHAAPLPSGGLLRLDLELVLRAEEGRGRRLTRTLFDRLRLDGRDGPEAGDTLAVVVDLPGRRQDDRPPVGAEPAASARVWAIARSWCLQADEASLRLAWLTGVEARAALPRVVAAGVESLRLSVQARPARRGSPLDTISERINQLPTPAPQPPMDFPSYTLDVLLDEVSARGARALSFQTARSLWVDLLEAKVLAEATGGRRRVVCASLVLDRLVQLHTERRAGSPSPPVVLTLGAGDEAALDDLPALPVEVAEDVRAFLARTPGGKVLIPNGPVPFAATEASPAHALYAWFAVDPSSGRMVGRTPLSLHGAITDPGWRQRAQAWLWNQGKERAEAAGREALEGGGYSNHGAFQAFFRTVAGATVGAGGVVDAVSFTLADAATARLSRDEWQAFAVEHAVGFAVAWLDRQGELYDGLDHKAAFWTGVGLVLWSVDGERGRRQVRQAAGDDLAEEVDGLVNAVVDEALNRGTQPFGDAATDLLGDQLGGAAHDQLRESLREGLRPLTDRVEDELRARLRDL
jgi:hypothetical protein